jgi:excinuclease ABC subunit A
VIKTADWVLDLGPEAGAGGGELVAEGPPDEVARNPRSHTAKFLQGLLATGPFAERPRFDPKAAARKALEAAKSSNDKVQPRTVEKEARKGKRQAEPAAESSASAQAPWEIDGRKWHTRDRVARNGRPARWDGRILELIVDRVEKLGAGCFAPTEWSERGVVRIDCTEGQKKNSFPFFHATTSGEWVVTLRFFVPRNTFKSGTLENALELVAFHESPTPVLSDAPRIKVATNAGPMQEITITAHSAADFESPAFDAFLTKAVAAILGRGKSAKLKKASEL